MKRLLCGGYERIFQLGKCFRAGEMGKLHNPEFTLLEWYRTNSDYMDILNETKDLLIYVATKCIGKTTINNTLSNPKSKIQNPKWVGGRMRGGALDLSVEWQIFSVGELFEKHAGWNPLDNFDERRFDDDLVNIVEPHLPKDRPVVLMDYPAQAAAFARLKPDNQRLAERWELYLGGVEIANACNELTDLAEHKRRFEEWTRKRREMGKHVYALDDEFLAALEKGLPPSAGVALGIDRLLMFLAGADSLDEVLPFRCGHTL
jgi:lysyl-tRNA synthetase class 2